MTDRLTTKEDHMSTCRKNGRNGGQSGGDDGGTCRRWIVTIGSFWSIFQFHMTAYGQGVFFLFLLERFGEGEARTSLVGSVYYGLFCFCAILASALINMFSCRVVCITGTVLHVIGLVLSAFVPSLNMTILTMGVFAGLGHSLSNAGHMCLLGFSFRDKRDILMAAAFLFTGLPILTSTPFLLFLASHLTYEEICFTHAAICAQSAIIAMLARPSSYENESSRRERKSRKKFCIMNFFNRMKSYIDLSLLLNCPYMWFLLTAACWNYSLFVVAVHFPNYVAVQGGSGQDISTLMMVFAISGMTGRITGCVLVRWCSRAMLPVQNIGLLLAGLITATFPLYSHLLSGRFVLAVISGIFLGYPNPVLTPLSISFVGPTKISEAYGFAYVFSGIGMALGPVVAGMMYSWTATYSSTFVLSGIISFLGGVVGFLSSKLRKPLSLPLAEPTVEIKDGHVEIKDEHVTWELLNDKTSHQNLESETGEHDLDKSEECSMLFSSETS